MFSRSNSNKLLLALSLIMFVSVATAVEQVKASATNYPMIMWQRESKVPTQEVDDIMTASDAVSNIESFVKGANGQNVLVFFKEGLSSEILS